MSTYSGHLLHSMRPTMVNIILLNGIVVTSPFKASRFLASWQCLPDSVIDLCKKNHVFPSKLGSVSHL